MNKQPWMLFHPEGTLVKYLWNGVHPILVFVHPTEEDPNDPNQSKHVWGGKGDSFTPVTEAEAKILNEAASTSRKSVFTLNKRRYIIDKKGEFVCAET